MLVFAGMQVGVLPGDLKFEVDESGAAKSSLVLSTSYNVLPIWLRIANDQMLEARRASEAISTGWTANDEDNRGLLVSEFEPSLQVFVACGISLDALYDQLRPFARLNPADIQAWKDNGTARGIQVTEVIRRVYRLNSVETATFRQSITEIFKYRDQAVHPSNELKRACTRPDIPVGVDWKFSAYRYANAAKCFEATMKMLLFLYERKSGVDDTDRQMDNVISALERLKVVTRKAAAP